MVERRVVLLIGGLAAAVALGLSALVYSAVGTGDAMRRIGGPFAMTDTAGHAVTDADLGGRPTALFFGYTHCPAFCPVTLQVLTTVMGRMGPAADRLNVVFVTVDPARDTPEAMRAYLASFDPRIRGFVGTEAQLAAMAKAFHVGYSRVPGEGGDYTMDHTVAVILLDARGRFAGTVTSDDDEGAIQARLEGLVRGAARSAGGAVVAARTLP